MNGETRFTVTNERVEWNLHPSYLIKITRCKERKSNWIRLWRP